MKKKDFQISSGNVFEDLGLSNPEERLAKAKLAMQINLLIKKKDLNQQEAGQLLGIDQPKISALAKGRLAGFSLERLFRFLNILGQDITIKVAPKTRTKEQSNISVSIPRTKQSPATVNNTMPARSALLARKKETTKSKRAPTKKKVR